MAFTSATFTSPVDGTVLATYAWGDDIAAPRGIVQVAHGLAEHSARYDRFARALVDAGFRVRSADHRGHGRSIAPDATPGDFGEAGFGGLIDDMAAYGAALAASEPDVPLYLFAHSMGSFAAQHVLLHHSAQYAGVVLSGSSALDVMAANLTAGGAAPAGLEAFNAGFQNRTGYEWLSRDTAEVDRYVADPLCGFDVPAATMAGMFTGTDRLADPEVLRDIRPGLPVRIASGEDDPLSGKGRLTQLLAQRYRDAGVTDVIARVYPGARHEILNEINRDEVTRDIVDWLVARS